MLLEGKTALVTGASSGIGFETVRILNQNGCRVYAVARDADRLSDGARSIDPTGKNVICVPCDVTSLTAVSEVFKRFEADGVSIDILVNAAGICRQFALESCSIDDIDETINTNLVSVIELSKRCFGMMKEKGGGKIVNISSVLGTQAQAGLAAYSTSKAGVAMLSRSMACEWAPYNIQVNCIAPGYISTNMTRSILSNDVLHHKIISRTPIGRVGTPTDVAQVVLFLCSDMSDFVTGAVIPADGGMSASLM
ncbi:MAG: SDR family NAD(P)-dependent oxidoreductase [Succinivibrio sp.]